jgi:Zn-dependent protease
MFGFGIDKKTIYIILGIILLLNFANMGTAGMISLLLSLPAVIIAITFHEFAHAYAADKLGDDTARMQGRLNLNPLSHTDPLGLIFLILVGFGWGRPVQINPNRFNHKYSLSASEAIVAIAGPIMNFALAFVFLIIFYFAQDLIPATEIGYYIVLAISRVIIINIGLGVFNLIPIPPLDGSKVLMHFLPYNAKQWFYEKESIIYIVFIILLIMPGSIIRVLCQ